MSSTRRSCWPFSPAMRIGPPRPCVRMSRGQRHCYTASWTKFTEMTTPGEDTATHRASSALADVDIAGWTLRFDLLSDPNRLEILLALHRAPGICVGDLAAALGRSENAVSQALRVLRQQGWVASTRVGRQVAYQLEDEIVHDLLHRIGARHG